MAEERTTQALPIEEINQLTKTLVDTMAEGTPKEIAKGLEAQFVDRSTEHLYRKVSLIDQSGSSVVYKYIKGFYIGEYKYREVLVPDGIPAIIPKELFDRVQEKLAKNKKAPARHKAEDDYLLTTKLFCGDCQSLMFGESGTSRSGTVYHYYKCSSAKKKTGCNRKPVKKKWIEDAVLQKVKNVLHDDVFIGDVIQKYLEYQKEENTVIPYLEKSLADTQRSIDNLIAAIEQGIITPSTKQRLETLEVTKRELEDKILIENMKRPLRTEDELWAWFRYMRNFDLTRLEERRQLIDVFVNTVFLYSDRFLLTLNFGYGSKTVLFTDIPCSDKVACGRPKSRF